MIKEKNKLLKKTCELDYLRNNLRDQLDLLQNETVNLHSEHFIEIGKKIKEFQVSCSLLDYKSFYQSYSDKVSNFDNVKKINLHFRGYTLSNLASIQNEFVFTKNKLIQLSQEKEELLKQKQKWIQKHQKLLSENHKLNESIDQTEKSNRNLLYQLQQLQNQQQNQLLNQLSNQQQYQLQTQIQTSQNPQLNYFLHKKYCN